MEPGCCLRRSRRRAKSQPSSSSRPGKPFLFDVCLTSREVSAIFLAHVHGSRGAAAFGWNKNPLSKTQTCCLNGTDRALQCRDGERKAKMGVGSHAEVGQGFGRRADFGTRGYFAMRCGGVYVFSELSSRVGIDDPSRDRVG